MLVKCNEIGKIKKLQFFAIIYLIECNLCVCAELSFKCPPLNDGQERRRADNSEFLEYLTKLIIVNVLCSISITIATMWPQNVSQILEIFNVNM